MTPDEIGRVIVQVRVVTKAFSEAVQKVTKSLELFGILMRVAHYRDPQERMLGLAQIQGYPVQVVTMQDGVSRVVVTGIHPRVHYR